MSPLQDREVAPDEEVLEEAHDIQRHPIPAAEEVEIRRVDFHPRVWTTPLHLQAPMDVGPTEEMAEVTVEATGTDTYRPHSIPDPPRIGDHITITHSLFQLQESTYQSLRSRTIFLFCNNPRIHTPFLPYSL